MARITRGNRVAGCLTAAALAASFVTIGSVPSAQGLGQSTVRASDCFSTAEPRDVVSRGKGPTYVSETVLRCGDPTKGIIHIDEEHNIAADGSDDTNVAKCHKNVMNLGDRAKSTNPRNFRWEIERPSGGKAIVIFNKETYNVITMYTTNGRSNNWSACARFPN